MNRCPNCGSTVNQRDNFCQSCGADLKEAGRGDSHGQERQTAGRRRQTQNSGQRGQAWGDQQSQSGGYEQQWEQQQDNGVSRRGLLAGGGVAVAAVVGGWFVFLREGSGDSATGARGPGTESQNSPDPGSSFADAPAVSAGRHGPYQITGGESHYLAVELGADDSLTVTMEFTHGNGDLDIELYDPEQRLRDSGRSVTDNEVVSLVADSAGTHYIKPYGFAGSSNGYELVVGVNS